MYLNYILAIILIEAITNIISKSDLFEPIRRYLFTSNYKIFSFIHRVIDCPYCTSVWVALFVTIMLYLYDINMLPFILTLFFGGIILHRLANILHFVIDRIDKYNSIDLSLEKEEEDA